MMQSVIYEWGGCTIQFQKIFKQPCFRCKYFCSVWFLSPTPSHYTTLVDKIIIILYQSGKCLRFSTFQIYLFLLSFYLENEKIFLKCCVRSQLSILCDINRLSTDFVSRSRYLRGLIILWTVKWDLSGSKIGFVVQ